MISQQEIREQYKLFLINGYKPVEKCSSTIGQIKDVMKTGDLEYRQWGKKKIGFLVRVRAYAKLFTPKGERK